MTENSQYIFPHIYVNNLQQKFPTESSKSQTFPNSPAVSHLYYNIQYLCLCHQNGSRFFLGNAEIHFTHSLRSSQFPLEKSDRTNAF